MRVITGTARGRKLQTPVGRDVRPTTDMVKEAIFSILHNDLPESRVLDLFAGSGQLGIEALSRGAKSATFIDENREAIACIKENLQHTGLFEQSSVALMDALSFLKRGGKEYDIIFLDPPYKKGILEEALPLALNMLAPKGIAVCETDRNEVLPEGNEAFRIYKEYRYGKIKLTVYRDQRM